MTGFFIYKNDLYEQTKKEHPDAKMTDLTKIISEKWRNIDEKTKEHYEKRYAEEKEKYVNNLKVYEEKYGKIEKKKRSKKEDSEKPKSKQSKTTKKSK